MLRNKSITPNERIISGIIYNGQSLSIDREQCISQELQRWLERSGQKGFRALAYIKNFCDGNDNQSNKQSCLNDTNGKLHYINDSSTCRNQISYVEKNSENILISCYNQASADNDETIPIYSYQNSLSGTYYSMTVNNRIPATNSMMRDRSFTAWLDQNKPNIIEKSNSTGAEFLFLWMVKNIAECDGCLIDGIRQGLSSLTIHNIGGQLSFLFTDGNGIYAYSGKGHSTEKKHRILYKVIRYDYNKYSYILSNQHQADDLDWICIPENWIYYFPVRGCIQQFPLTWRKEEVQIRPNRFLKWAYQLSEICY